MSEPPERQDDGARLRETFGYLLRDHVAYQDGRHSDAPSVVFADGDYEVGDGTCGLHPDGKRCNEPAIIYARADALVDALSRAKKAEAERDAAVTVRQAAKVLLDASGDWWPSQEAKKAAINAYTLKNAKCRLIALTDAWHAALNALNREKSDE